MNQYVFSMGSPAAMTAAQLKRAVACYGYCALMGAEFHHMFGSTGASANKVMNTRATVPMRLPSYLGVGKTPANIDGAGECMVMLSVMDAQATQELNNMERAIVNQGDFVAALLAPGVSVDNELVNSTSLAFDNGYTIVFGQASQSAQDGVYQTPFATAMAYVNFGSLTSIQGLVNNGTPLPPTQQPTVPVAGGAAPVRGGARETNITPIAVR